MRELSFTIVGEPAPQGSKRHVGNGRMIEASKKVAPWRAAVVKAVAPLTFEPFDGPLEIECNFYVRRPKTVSRLLPTVPPDLDKLVRGLFDALTIANVWVDDALVIRITESGMYYCEGDELPGCDLTVRSYAGIRPKRVTKI